MYHGHGHAGNDRIKNYGTTMEHIKKYRVSTICCRSKHVLKNYVFLAWRNEQQWIDLKVSELVDHENTRRLGSEHFCISVHHQAIISFFKLEPINHIKKFLKLHDRTDKVITHRLYSERFLIWVDLQIVQIPCQIYFGADFVKEH